MKRVDEIIVGLDDIKKACRSAFNGHSKKREVIDFSENIDMRSSEIFELFNEGKWNDCISYRKLDKKNKNGKVRHIDSPNLVTRIYQHLFLNKIRPIYEHSDNYNGLNCKIGCGLTSKIDSRSLIKRMKHVYDLSQSPCF